MDVATVQYCPVLLIITTNSSFHGPSLTLAGYPALTRAASHMSVSALNTAIAISLAPPTGPTGARILKPHEIRDISAPDVGVEDQVKAFCTDADAGHPRRVLGGVASAFPSAPVLRINHSLSYRTLLSIEARGKSEQAGKVDSQSTGSALFPTGILRRPLKVGVPAQKDCYWVQPRASIARQKPQM